MPNSSWHQSHDITAMLDGHEYYPDKSARCIDLHKCVYHQSLQHLIRSRGSHTPEGVQFQLYSAEHQALADSKVFRTVPGADRVQCLHASTSKHQSNLVDVEESHGMDRSLVSPEPMNISSPPLQIPPDLLADIPGISLYGSGGDVDGNAIDVT
ncbi:hypothetical protein M404DRAFT_10676 [Pisolithus tinctorius Marx 270]|uniref:Uncharacterized protein n=1 Tax=Pisolithus tinctorius Marx 270 TaxID=870435 RepID=A0A0C3ILV8_PISTI|nr:hypothetical protein M404DRAFT_10676 [Pisolithus tinctorius Marx 270]